MFVADDSDGEGSRRDEGNADAHGCFLGERSN